MKKLTLSEMFKGYTDIDIPAKISNSIPTEIVLSESEAPHDSLLFVTERADGQPRNFDYSRVGHTIMAAVVQKAQYDPTASYVQIPAGNVRAALSYALSNAYGIDYDKIKIVGVTGTNGKTTTATLIYTILRQCGYKAGFIGTGKILCNDTPLCSENYSMTTPDPAVLYPSIAKMIRDGCRYIVMEVSSHSIALNKIAPIKFEYAIFTNLDNDHLDFHGTKEEYFNTKLKLFSMCKKGLFNLDDKYSGKASEMVKCDKSTYGIINPGLTYATDIEMSLNGTTFFFREKNLIFKIKSDLIGAFNVYNIIAAVKCTIDLGIKPCIAKAAVEEAHFIEGRMEVLPGKITVIIDYAHTPFAFYNCLKTIKRSINVKQKLLVVFGCGGQRDRSKRPFFGKYAAELADEIIITEDNCRNESFDDIAKDIIAGIVKKGYQVIPDRENAIKYALKSASPGDVVAIIGKGHERYKIVADQYIPFDERKIVQETLLQLGGAL